MQTHPARSCGPCRKCCEGWLTAHLVVPGVVNCTMKPGTPCTQLSPQACSVYEQRPQHPCRTFVCGWLIENGPFPPEFRPDMLQVIIVPITWKETRAWVLVPAPQPPCDTLMAQMRGYTQATQEPHMIKLPGKLLCYGASEFQRDMLTLEQQGLAPWEIIGTQ